MPQPARDQVFISYSHEDTKWREDLERHLKPYLRAGSIKGWSDKQIVPGSSWFGEIKAALAQTNVAVLLITPDFLASDFIYEHELGPLLKEAEQGGVAILWVPVYASAYKQTALEKYQAVLDPSKPIGSLSKAKRNQAWVKICEEIKKAVNPSKEYPPEDSFKDAAPQSAPPIVVPPVGDRSDLPRSLSRSSGTIFQAPHRRNPLFIGRERELEKLSALLDIGSSEVRVFVLAGIGGIGKTQLTVEFAHRYRDRFTGGIFWLNMTDANDVGRQVAKCAGPGGLDLPDYENWSFEDRIAAVKQAWQQPISRLIVFDNCESEALVVNWCPQIGGCTILITSRRLVWDPTLGTQVVQLDMLPRSESISLLIKPSQNLLSGNEEDLDAIAAELGDLPLALHLASSYLALYRHAVTPAKYLAQLRSTTLLQHPSLQLGGISPTGHEQHVARTFQLSYDRLNADDGTDTRAIALLARAACFAPGVPILRYMLYLTRPMSNNEANDYSQGQSAINSAITLSAENMAKSITDAVRDRLERRTDKQFEDALTRLLELGLIESLDDSALRMHPLIVAFVGDHVPEGEALADVWRMLFGEWCGPDHRGNIQPNLYFQNWKDPDHPDYDFLPHLRHVIDTGLTRQTWWALDAARGLGVGLQSIGDYAGARFYFERILAYCERVPQANAKVGRSLNDLGLLLEYQGDLADARKHFERALEIREHELGKDHPLLGTLLNNIGLLLHRQGDLDSAYKYLKRAQAIRGRPIDQDDHLPASILNNLGVVLLDQKDSVGAHECFERALKFCEYMFAGFHDKAVVATRNLGKLLKEQGDMAGARKYFDRALTISESVHGSDAPTTATILVDLGELLRDQGDQDGARECLERALVIWERKLVPDHAATRFVRYQLAALDASRKTGKG